MGRCHAASRPRWATTAAAVLAFAVFAAGVVGAELKNDFGLYPAGAQSCLSQAAEGSGCTGDTASEMNGCLCRNAGNFILPAARCIGKSSPADLEGTYSQLVSNCNDSKTQVTVTKQEFLQAGEEGATATSTTTGTSATGTGAGTDTGSQTTTTVTPTDDNSHGSTLTTAEIIGISVVGAVAVASIVAGIFVFFRRRRRRAKKTAREESHPMLSPGAGSTVAFAAPTHPYATSPNTLSELPSAEVGGGSGGATPIGSMAGHRGSWSKASATWGGGGTGSGATTPHGQWNTQTANWTPPPGYSFTARHDGQVHEMPITPARAHYEGPGSPGLALGLGQGEGEGKGGGQGPYPTLVPIPAEMDATDTAYRGTGDGGAREWGR